MKTVSLKIPEEVDAVVATAARRAGMSKSAFIRAAVRDRLERVEGTGTFLDQASDLIGCLEGPADLSGNPKHFEGYGGE